MSSPKPKIAIIYDFDKTLCTRDMQEYTFISKIGSNPKSFWSDCKDLAEKESMDNTLAYMYQMLNKSKKSGNSIRREDFTVLGKSIKFYSGVKEWFRNIETIANEIGVTVEHYVISSGLKEIIEGCDIYKNFKEVYACEFYYDPSGVAVWPKNVINYTTKTQCLFRINKGVFNISDDTTINEFKLDEERYMPFPNMIYIGDGITDVPCLKLVKKYGGHSIGVYNRSKKIVSEMMKDGRIDFVCKADYTKEKELFNTVVEIMDWIRCNNCLVTKNSKDYKAAIKWKGEQNID